jgi:hypothetical protein
MSCSFLLPFTKKQAWLAFLPIALGTTVAGCGSSQPSSADDSTGAVPEEDGSGGQAGSLGGPGSDSDAGSASDVGTQTLMDGARSGGVGRYTVFELTIPFAEAGLANTWEDVTVSAVFTSPSGKQIAVRGFYYATDTWKVRFAPSELGSYGYHASISSSSNKQNVDGKFDCVASAEKGFVRSSQQNPLRLVFEDGTLYNALGMGSCVQDPAVHNWGLDGGDRSAGEPAREVDIDTYLQAMAGEAKLNIYRWSVNNCAFEMWNTIAPSGNKYLVREGQWGDSLVATMRKYGLRVYMDFFGWKPMFATSWQDKLSMDAVKRYVDYVVARYGAYVDFWEVCNESSPPGEWISLVAQYVESIDPYHHMLSSSWERPDLAAITVASPHWYEKEAELASDTRTIAKIEPLRGARKPIIFGEQGNSGQNWDPLSSLRARIRSWTAFFDEGHLIFWESNFAKDYKASAANLYIGPDLRKYFNVLQTFTAAMPADVTRVTINVAPSTAARAYGLQSSQGFYAYVRDAQSYTANRSGVTLAVNLTKNGVARFYDTKTGAIVQEVNVVAGAAMLAVPDFVGDVALAIRY